MSISWIIICTENKKGYLPKFFLSDSKGKKAVSNFLDDFENITNLA